LSAISPIRKLEIKKDCKILLVSSSDEVILNIEKTVKQLGASIIVTNDGDKSLDCLKNERISYVLIDINSEGFSCDRLVKSMRDYMVDRNVPIIILASADDEEKLSQCVYYGCDDFLFEPFTSISLNARMASLSQISELKILYKDSINEQLVANRVLKNALEERSVSLEDIGLFKTSASVFSGDLFLTVRHKDGSLNVLLADFTGHGLSAAIGALPVADIFSVMTEKGFELDYILENINSKLYTLLPTSMFMACCVLNISNDLKSVKVWNGGLPDIYVRSYGTGHVKYKIKSSHIPLGIDEAIKNRFELEVVSLSPGDEFILYTDGLTEAMNKDNIMFGCNNINQCLQTFNNDLSIFKNLVETFNEFCGDTLPDDDVTLACIPCTLSLMDSSDIKTSRT